MSVGGVFFRQTIYLPVPGLVPTEELTPGDLVGTNKDSYLILEKLPAEYDNRVKAMEVDEKPTEEYSDIGGKLMSSSVAVTVLKYGPNRRNSQIYCVELLDVFSPSVERLQSASRRCNGLSPRRSNGAKCECLRVLGKWLGISSANESSRHSWVTPSFSCVSLVRLDDRSQPPSRYLPSALKLFRCCQA